MRESTTEATEGHGRRPHGVGHLPAPCLVAHAGPGPEQARHASVAVRALRGSSVALWSPAIARRLDPRSAGAPRRCRMEAARSGVYMVFSCSSRRLVQPSGRVMLQYLVAYTRGATALIWSLPPRRRSTDLQALTIELVSSQTRAAFTLRTAMYTGQLATSATPAFTAVVGSPTTVATRNASDPPSATVVVHGYPHA